MSETKEGFLTLNVRRMVGMLWSKPIDQRLRSLRDSGATALMTRPLTCQSYFE